MIIEALIRTFFDIAKGLISLTGTLPDMPSSIVTGLDFVKDSYEIGIEFLNALVGKPLTVAIVTTAFLIIAFYTAWKPINWIFNKIRGSGT